MKKFLSLITIIALSVGLTACSLPGLKGQASEDKATRELFAMDTYMTLTAYGDEAQAAVDAAAEEITRLDNMLSTGDENSEISQLNAAKEAKLSEDAYALTRRACEFYEDTDGAFNIAIYPIMQLWGFYTGDYKVPAQDELTAALDEAHPEDIAFDDATSTVTLPDNMAIDLGGIAKGYTSASIMDIFEEYGCSGIVSLGGNIECRGKKPDGGDYNIAIQDPDDESSYIGYLTSSDKAVVTSGGYQRYFEEDGTTYHHIIDPATGYPARSGLKSVSIISEDGTLADALSTSIYIMGLDKGISYWKVHDRAFDMVLLTDDDKLYVTENIADIFTTEISVQVIK